MPAEPWVEDRYGWTRIPMAGLPLLIVAVNIVLVYLLVSKSHQRLNWPLFGLRLAVIFALTCLAWFIAALPFAINMALGATGWAPTPPVEREQYPDYQAFKALEGFFAQTIGHFEFWWLVLLLDILLASTGLWLIMLRRRLNTAP